MEDFRPSAAPVEVVSEVISLQSAQLFLEPQLALVH